MKRDEERLPNATRKLKQLIDNEFNGNVSEFSKHIGFSQQVINRLFNIDKRSGKYPTISARIMQTVCDEFNIRRDYFFEDRDDTMLIRIKQLQEDSGLNEKDFAKKVGIDAQAFEKKLSGEAEFDDEDLMAISKALNIRLGWLVAGTGQVSLLPEKMRQQVAIDTYRAKMNNKTSEEEHKGIPLIPVHAMAGALSGDSTTVNPWDVEDMYIVPAFRKSDFCIRVDGDSMEPRYCKGDIIACTRVPLTDLWFQWHKIYVIDTRQGALVKHVEKGSDDDHIMLVSENPDYKPFEIPTSEIFGLAIVNGVIRVE